jgi:membrane-bound lytic murein transglycosylase A
LIKQRAVLKAYGLLAAVLALFVSACAVRQVPTDGRYIENKTPLHLTAVAFKTIPGWVGDNHAEALVVFLKSCKKHRVLSSVAKLGSQEVTVGAEEWQKVCVVGAKVKKGSKIEAQYFFESHFTPYLVSDGSDPVGLFTGYYEPELRGAWRPNITYQYPIYGRPQDLVSVDLGSFRSELMGTHLVGRRAKTTLIPYYTRAEINRGMLKGKQLEILWVDSAIDAFFLHIQGSGRIVFSDGSKVRVSFAGRNGQRYTPIGRELVALNILKPDQVSLQSIQRWLAANPVAGLELMEKNKAYIFFHIRDGEGPVGAQGVVLTSGRSLAVDRKYIPLGAPIWLVTTEPGKAEKPIRRLVIAQDTGSAIKGSVRGDLFIGHGPKAGIIAGNMKQRGKYFLLLPKR